MDFCVLATIVGMFMMALTILYDIACQWSQNFIRRVGQFPSWMQVPMPVLQGITYVIPKFHIYGHGTKCQTQYSLNYNQHSACTNGEEPEKWWAYANPISMSTREMGPGARHDTIDDHAAAWNWVKITNFGIG
jgi:Kyakuja-Dileera-Zisupton transposase